MKSSSIKTKVIVMFIGIIFFISIIISLISVYSLNKLSSQEIEKFSQTAYHTKTNELKNNIHIVMSIIQHHYDSSNPNKQKLALEEVSKIRYGKSGYFWVHNTELNMVMHPIKPSLNGKSVAEVKDAAGTFIFAKMNETIQSSQGEGQVSYFWPKPSEPKPQEKFSYVQIFKPWGWVLGTGAYVDEIEKNIAIMKENASEEINNIIIEMIIFTLIVMGLCYILIVIGFNKIIVKPLERFKNYFDNFLKFISMENNQYYSAKVNSKDEISEMLIMLNETAKQFDKKLKDDIKVMGEVVLLTDKVEQGIYKCRVKSTSENPMITTLQKSINKLLSVLESNMASIENTLETYSKGNFTQRIDISPKLKENMLAVMNGVNNLGATLEDNAKQNLINGERLQENSSSMTVSMNNLATKANEQAASLEETSATVEEITALTRSNAQNSAQMATLGQTVKQAVISGQKLADETAASMDEINQRVNSISESINVIDQIAFQTNILSLNAAVEAATAGEAGKGFAVVAQEVRNLAGRSADAAREIKQLVEDANLKANEGKTISTAMIAGYEELNNHITQTIHIIEDVSRSSKEQMSGIEQINDSVSMLDQVTQENAHEANSIQKTATEVQTMADELVSQAQTKKFN